MERIRKFEKILLEENLDGLFIIKGTNIRYLTGFTGSDSYAIVSPKGRAFITDSRYTEQAERECRDFEIVKWRSPNAGLPETIKAVCKSLGIKRLGFEKGFVSVELYENIKSQLEDMEFIGTSGLVEKVRRVKEEAEIECIRRAAKIADEAFLEILGYVKPGVTEKDVERELGYLIRKKGADDIGFSLIIASGKNSSMPHAVPSDKKIESGDFVTFDMGALYKGYRSDMTRTVVVGQATEEQRRMYELVRKSLEESRLTVKAGVDGKLPDRRAREVLQEAEARGIFEYGVGHGVGLDIHEDPFMSQRCPLTLETGNVVTVEPGIYIPGWGGIRIEDTVVVRDGECEVLTNSPRELIII